MIHISRDILFCIPQGHIINSLVHFYHFKKNSIHIVEESCQSRYAPKTSTLPVPEWKVLITQWLVHEASFIRCRTWTWGCDDFRGSLLWPISKMRWLGRGTSSPVLLCGWGDHKVEWLTRLLWIFSCECHKLQWQTGERDRPGFSTDSPEAKCVQEGWRKVLWKIDSICL